MTRGQSPATFASHESCIHEIGFEGPWVRRHTPSCGDFSQTTCLGCFFHHNANTFGRYCHQQIVVVWSCGLGNHLSSFNVFSSQPVGDTPPKIDITPQNSNMFGGTAMDGSLGFSTVQIDDHCFCWRVYLDLPDCCACCCYCCCCCCFFSGCASMDFMCYALVQVSGCKLTTN